MKFKKVLFPIMLIMAITLTTAGILSISKSFAVPSDTASVKTFNLYIDNIYTNNISVIDNNLTYLKYNLKLDENNKEYIINFDVINNGNYNAKLNKINVDKLPDNLRGIVTSEVSNNNSIAVNGKDTITIKYSLRDNLKTEEKEILKEFSNLSINVVLDYIEA